MGHKELTIDTTAKGIERAKMYSVSPVPHGSKVMGTVKSNGSTGALIKLSSGNFVKLNAGVITRLPLGIKA